MMMNNLKHQENNHSVTSPMAQAFVGTTSTQKSFRRNFHFPPVFPGHRDYIGVGKPTPPMVPLVQYTGDLASSKWAAYCHRSVYKGGGEKSPMGGEIGDAG